MTESNSYHERMQKINGAMMSGEPELLSQEDCEFVQNSMERIGRSLSELPKMRDDLDELLASNKAASEQIKKGIDDGNKGFKKVGEAISHINDKVHNHDRRINDLTSRIHLIENLSTQTKFSIDMLSKMSEQNLEYSKLISKTLDGKSIKSSTSKPSLASKIPWQGWIAGAVVAIGVASMFTGHFSEFMTAISRAAPEKAAAK